MAMLGAPPMQIFASQIGQVVQVAQMAEGGVKGFAVELGSMLVAFAPVIAVGAAAVGWLALFSRSVSAGVDTDARVSSLGLTTKEIGQLKHTSVSQGEDRKRVG